LHREGNIMNANDTPRTDAILRTANYDTNDLVYAMRTFERELNAANKKLASVNVRLTDTTISNWAKRHDISRLLSEARDMVDDAASLYMVQAEAPK